MSFDAIAWAMDQSISRSSAKFLLVALADCVNGSGVENMVCFPSIAHLARRSAQDEKTVQANLQRLREMGFIEDTGERRGATGQVIVYKLKTPKNGGVADKVLTCKDPQISGETPTKTGALEIDETPPNFRDNTPKFPPKDPQISGETPPKTGEGTTKEPVVEQVMEPVKSSGKRKAAGLDATAIELPDWLPVEAWGMWVRDRADRKKPVTNAAAKLHLRKLETLRAGGHDPVLVIENAIENGWQGLYAAKDGSTKAVRQLGQGGVPPCPFDRVFDAFDEALPMLPQPRRSLFVDGDNAIAMRKRWEWVMVAKHEKGDRKGERLAVTVDEGMEWFSNYFAYVAESDFLTGRNGRFTACDLGWLVSAENFEKVLSGKYHGEQREAIHA